MARASVLFSWGVALRAKVRDVEIDPSLRGWLGGAIVAYLVAMYLISVSAARKIHNVDDFLVAGRRLPLSLAWMTLLATWFGAGTLLAAADEVHASGLQAAALDPLGAGVCLLLAGLFVAGPMWRMNLLTVPDFFRTRFGASAELIASLILVPSYFGWIAAQFTALAGVMEMFFGLPVVWGILLVAVIGTGYTLLGGMWSVTLTDAVQITLVLLGLVVLLFAVLLEAGGGSVSGGWFRLRMEVPAESWGVVPGGGAAELVGWLGVFAIGALGNLPGQDLMQRVFAAKSARTARLACLVAGVLYLVFGAIPVLLALAGQVWLPSDGQWSVIPGLAHAFLHPVVLIVFLLAVISAILSTIDSAILSPASVISQNLLPRIGWRDTISSSRWSVVGVALCSLVVAYLGESAYALLEEAYLLTLVGLFVPLMLGLYSRPRSGWPATVSMLTGTGLWGVHWACGWETFLSVVPGFAEFPIPLSLGATFAALAAYWVIEPPWVMAWCRAGDESLSG